MNKIISIYELLGLIKDGKAPKKIKCYGLIYKLVYRDTIQGSYDYESETQGYLTANLSEQKYLSDILNVEVEILEPVEEEFIEIEEFCISYSLDYIDYRNIDVLKNYLNKDFQTIFDTLDKLIKNQKKIIEKLKEEGK